MSKQKDRYDVMFSHLSYKRVDNNHPRQNHVVDNEKDPSKTLCGKPVLLWVKAGLSLENVTCIICRRILKKRGLIGK